MPFCNWCQLESESPDTCDWCKRPIARNVAVYSSYGDGVALLREDAADTTDRAAVVVGGIVAIAFFCLVVYAAVNFSGSKPKKSSDPLNSIAQTERTWTGTKPTPPVTAPPQAAAPAAPPTPVASAPARQPNPNRSGGSATGSPAASATAPRGSSVTATPAGFSARDGEVAPNGVYIESAKLGTIRQKDGDYTIEGVIMVGNISGHRAYEIEFFLVVGERKVRLRSNNTDLGHGITGGFSVRAVSVAEDIAKAENASIQIFANTDAGKVADSLALGG